MRENALRLKFYGPDAPAVFLLITDTGKYRKLCELRVKSKVLIRIIFYPCPNGDSLLLYAFIKRQKRDTMQALEQSLRILDALREHPERAVEYKVREEGV